MPHKRDELPAQPYEHWEEQAKGLIEEQMVRRGISYKQLSQMLERLKIYEPAGQINRKINRRRFSAAFLFACLRAMEVENIRVPQSKEGQNGEE
ncbi:hypothetical protein AYM40_00020 [Paraburkholderia phytofirmans OLGA172]|uniref:DUF6471 domain-containing protein n=1 Tax=Paraburkholderia phytofirmans OLGA172 TaxID=1417228 RepID=A0A167VLM1_9BURK|nr:DUF6471 domain-containing protein [Paraburkholderia phytofirmans]ANB70911.1 hypothetical protein AYM40_00020 [Paraburkholderia phytofirmans OLGA172]